MMKKYARGGMPPIGDSVASGNRMSGENAKDAKAVAKTASRKMPPIGESVKSGNRMSKENAKDTKAVKKYAKGGSVTRGDGIAKKGKTKGKMV
jgi:hypothetical protein